MWSYENKSKSVLYKAVQIVQNGFIAAPPVSGDGVQNELTWCPEWVEQAEQLIRPMGPIGPIRHITKTHYAQRDSKASELFEKLKNIVLNDYPKCRSAGGCPLGYAGRMGKTAPAQEFSKVSE